MYDYRVYVRSAESLLNAGKATDPASQAALAALLDGGPAKALRRTIALPEQRRQGAFFTGHLLAKKLVDGVSGITKSRRLMDPTCGVGDLLLAAAATLPIRKTLAGTLSEWGSLLSGFDTQPSYLRLARTRLALLALQRGANHDGLTSAHLKRLFPRILRGNALKQRQVYEDADCVLLNPPFGLVDAPETCDWASGKITAAALFAEKALSGARAGAVLAMILPDVLRSGSRYRHWRESIQRQAKVLKAEPYGLFDQTADVDVFLLYLVKRQRECGQTLGSFSSPGRHPTSCNLADLFDVGVGPVVPYRDKGTGPLRPFLEARALPKWRVWKVGREKRRTDGRGFHPPFVVVRRTSRPGDAHRAVATVIVGNAPVAVENHLLVLVPKDGKLRTCRSLVARLKQETTNRWLNQRIRCRHLTVTAMRELPLQSVALPIGDGSRRAYKAENDRRTDTV